MQSISQIGSRINRDIPITGNNQHIHIAKSIDNRITSEFRVKFFLKDTIYDKSKKTGNKMSCDVIFAGKINRTSFTLMLHDSEAFFNFPSFFIDANNISSRIRKLSANGVKDASTVTASNTYQMLILKTIFGDMGGRLGEQMKSKAVKR